MPAAAGLVDDGPAFSCGLSSDSKQIPRAILQPRHGFEGAGLIPILETLHPYIDLTWGRNKGVGSRKLAPPPTSGQDGAQAVDPEVVAAPRVHGLPGKAAAPHAGKVGPLLHSGGGHLGVPGVRRSPAPVLSEDHFEKLFFLLDVTSERNAPVAEIDFWPTDL